MYGPEDSGNPRERSAQEAVNFAIQSAKELIGWLPGHETSLRDKTVLEVGPGQDFGMPLILMGFGAHMILVDRYLCDWDPRFHSHYYLQLREAVVDNFLGIDTRPLDEVIKAEAHIVDGMTLLRTGLETPHEIPDESVDVSYSNAVFEHLGGVYIAIQQLARITRQGGLGFHQIDLRDHRDFDRPLEYLTRSPAELEAFLQDHYWSCGNAVRYNEFQTCFEIAGFSTRFEPNLFADERYAEDIRTLALQRYRDMPPDALNVLGGRFFLEKKKAPNGAREVNSGTRLLWDSLVDVDARLSSAHDRIAKLKGSIELAEACLHRRELAEARLHQQLVERDLQLRRYERIGADHVVRVARLVKGLLLKVRSALP